MQAHGRGQVYGQERYFLDRERTRFVSETLSNSQHCEEERATLPALPDVQPAGDCEEDGEHSGRSLRDVGEESVDVG
jgi:hypothetical protein